MTGRDPNRGQCVQACRFKYKMYALEEDLRKGELFPLYEDEEGTHILNSKDLCMIQYIPELIDAGIASLKIEGRLKSEYYVATVVRAYRKAIDLYYSSNGSEKLKKEVENLQKEVEKSANRGFTTGFYFDKPNQETNNYLSSRAESQAGYIGRVLGYDNDKKMLKFEVKNHLLINSKLEIFSPDKTISYALKEMFKDGQSIEVAHANNIVEIPLEEEMPTDSLIRILL
jgi:putative protease